jgi:hypothetical protein
MGAAALVQGIGALILVLAEQRMGVLFLAVTAVGYMVSLRFYGWRWERMWDTQ